METFAIPSFEDWGEIGAVCVMDTLFVSAFLSGVMLTSPLLMSVGQLLVIPTTFTWDIMFNGYKVQPLGILGSSFIFVGFILMEVPVCFIVKKKMGWRKSTQLFSTKHSV